jgi:hypothetical protein
VVLQYESETKIINFMREGEEMPHIIRHMMPHITLHIRDIFVVFRQIQRKNAATEAPAAQQHSSKQHVSL